MYVFATSPNPTYFNPRSHEGNDKQSNDIYSWYKQFQSTFPRGERHCILRICHTVLKFQSTFPRGERRKCLECEHKFYTFQSTFPRGERQKSSKDLERKVKISIHVPTRGTTLLFGFLIFVYINFNPRSHEGNDWTSL